MAIGARSTNVEETVRKEVEIWNRHDVGVIGKFYTEDAVVYDPQYEQPLRGREAIERDARDFLTAFPDLTMRLSNIVSAEGNCGFEVVGSGTHRGPLAGPSGSIPPTNKRIETKGAIFIRVNAEGLITEEHRYFDLAGMAAQLGIQP